MSKHSLIGALLIGILAHIPLTADASITLAQIDEAIVDSELAIAVYNPSKIQVGEWKQIARRSDPDGFKAAVYERTLANGKRDLRVVFAGTDDRQDAALDVRQGAFLPRTIYDDIDEQQFARAQAFAAGYVHLAKSDTGINSFRLVGHSLGGAFAQYVSAKTGADATVYNSAALLKMEDRLSSVEKQRADSHVRQYYGSLDYVQRPTRWIGGTQHGAHFLLESVDKYFLGAHSVENLRKSLQAARADVAKNPKSEAWISERVPITQEMADLLIRHLTLMGDGIQELKHTVDLKNEFGRGHFGSKAMSKTLGGIAGAVEQVDSWKGVYDLAGAIRKDQEQFREKPFVLLHSYTFEALAEAALTGYSIPGVKEAPGGGGLLRALYTALDDLKVIPAQTRVSLLRESVDVGAPTFGFIDFARAGLGYARKGRIEIDEIEAICDGIVGALWAGVGLATSGGNLRVAEMYQDVAQLVVADGRLFMKETGADKQLLRWIPGWGREYRQQCAQIMEMYQVLQNRRAYDGQSIQSFDEFLEGSYPGSKGSQPGVAEEIRKAFTAEDWQSVAHIEAELRATAKQGRVDVTSSTEAKAQTQKVGGVKMAPEPVPLAPESPGILKGWKESLRKSRTSTNELIGDTK